MQSAAVTKTSLEERTAPPYRRRFNLRLFDAVRWQLLPLRRWIPAVVSAFEVQNFS